MAHDQYETMSPVIFALAIGVVIIIIIFICCDCSIKALFHPLDREVYSKKWSRIQQLSSIEESYPLAIIYANSLLDAVLKKLNYSGDTMLQRLTSAKRIFKNEKQVRDANELRNRIAHNIDMETLPENKMREALQAFRQALVDLGAL